MQDNDQPKIEAFKSFMKIILQGTWDEPLNMENMFSLYATHIEMFLLKDESGKDRQIEFSSEDIREQLKRTQITISSLYNELSITEKKTRENQNN